MELEAADRTVKHCLVPEVYRSLEVLRRLPIKASGIGPGLLLTSRRRPAQAT